MVCYVQSVQYDVQPLLFPLKECLNRANKTNAVEEPEGQIHGSSRVEEERVRGRVSTEVEVALAHTTEIMRATSIVTIFIKHRTSCFTSVNFEASATLVKHSV